MKTEKTDVPKRKRKSTDGDVVMMPSKPPELKVGETVPIVVPPMPTTILEVDVQDGGSGMLQNRMTEDARAAIMGTRPPGAKPDHREKSKHWRETLHQTTDGKLGFPAEAFLKAMGNVVKGVDLRNKKLFKYPKDLYRALHIKSEEFDIDGNGIVLFTAGKAEMNCHWANIPTSKQPIPVYRALIKDWKMTLKIVYNASLLNEHDVLLLLNRAGHSVGVGAFRVENRGPYGLFEVTGARFTTLDTVKKKKAA